MPGCGTPDYPAHFAFPSRTDRLVLKSPDAPPPGPPEPGRLERDLSELDARGGKTAEPLAIPESSRTELDRFLREIFGTPAAPIFQTGDSESQRIAGQLGLENEGLAEGSKLFRKHCLGCHGLTGDGRGQAALFLKPYPRDFRRGAFKFVSSGENMKPRRSDLLRTIEEGMKGTPMPAFGLLPATDREQLARYVTYLALRGQVEFETLESQLPGGRGGAVEAVAGNRIQELIAEWDRAEHAAALPVPPDDGEPMTTTHFAAVKRGYELFIAKTGTECLKCHVEFGRKPLLRYDLWGTIATPANFTSSPSESNPLKGGSRPEDVYVRIRFGIVPVGMPAHPKLSDRDVWDLVRFVRSAAYPRELPPDVRDVVYPKSP